LAANRGSAELLVELACFCKVLAWYSSCATLHGFAAFVKIGVRAAADVEGLDLNQMSAFWSSVQATRHGHVRDEALALAAWQGIELFVGSLWYHCSEKSEDFCCRAYAHLSEVLVDTPFHVIML
jgi:hypothetical protein